MNIFFYDVAISVPLRQCFTYSSNLKIEKGSRVLVPFGNRKVIGLVIKKSKEAIGNNIEIKKIISSIDTYPVLINQFLILFYGRLSIIIILLVRFLIPLFLINSEKQTIK
jgi:primosomal protein N' (replication factor Y)